MRFIRVSARQTRFPCREQASLSDIAQLEMRLCAIQRGEELIFKYFSNLNFQSREAWALDELTFDKGF